MGEKQIRQHFLPAAFSSRLTRSHTAPSHAIDEPDRAWPEYPTLSVQAPIFAHGPFALVSHPGMLPLLDFFQSSSLTLSVAFAASAALPTASSTISLILALALSTAALSLLEALSKAPCSGP
jgi:hypothetical protein